MLKCHRKNIADNKGPSKQRALLINMNREEPLTPGRIISITGGSPTAITIAGCVCSRAGSGTGHIRGITGARSRSNTRSIIHTRRIDGSGIGGSTVAAGIITTKRC